MLFIGCGLVLTSQSYFESCDIHWLYLLGNRILRAVMFIGFTDWQLFKADNHISEIRKLQKN